MSELVKTQTVILIALSLAFCKGAKICCDAKVKCNSALRYRVGDRAGQGQYGAIIINFLPIGPHKEILSCSGIFSSDC